MLKEASTRERCQAALLLATVVFCVLGITFRVLGFHMRELGFGDSLVSNDVYNEILISRYLLSGDLDAVHSTRYGEGLDVYLGGRGVPFVGVPFTALPVLPIVAVLDHIGADENTVWALAGIPFVLTAPLAAWVMWRLGRTGPREPDAALVAVALLLAPLTFEVTVFEARGYFLFALLDLAALLAVRRSAARSGAWMGVALAAKPTSIVTALVLGAALLVDAVRQRSARRLLVWSGWVVGVFVVCASPFLLANGRTMLANYAEVGALLPVHRGTLPWYLLSLQGATSPHNATHEWLQARWTGGALALLQGLVALALCWRRRLRPEAPALVALAAAGHAFVVGLSKTAWVRYGVYPGTLAVAWAVQPQIGGGLYWAVGVLAGQTFVLTAVPQEWRGTAFCAFHAVLAVALWVRARPEPAAAESPAADLRYT